MRAMSIIATVCVLLFVTDTRAQTPDEHASHHPGAAGSAMPVTPGAAPAAGGMGGMMEGMGEMMKGMHGTPPKELYPTLMALPELSPEQRQLVGAQAAERMHAGSALMGHALDSLNTGAQSGDYAAMQEAATRLREGLAQMESGIAARRALAEGRAPRAVALAWFQREMNLSPAAAPTAHEPFGGLRFHLTVIALLAAFAVAIIAMYFCKMRRAHALLARLADGGATVATTPPATAPAAPVASGWKGILRVSRIFDETPGVKTFRFTAMDGGPIPFTYLPGQYLSIFPVIDGRRTPRCYTMASSPTQRHYCELTIKREAEGKGVSRYTHDGLQEGELLEAAGPAGKFTFTGAEAKSVVLISGGVGITPMMSYVRHLTDSGWPGEIFFLHTCRHASEFIFRGELERLCARHPKLHLVVTITRPNEEPWSGLTGHLTKELIAQSVPEIATRLVYVCGPDAMMRAAQAALLELGVPAAQVKTEAFSAPQAAPADVVEKEPETTATPTLETLSAAPSAVSVTFQKSDKTAPLAADQCILEAAEAVGVKIENDCRAGTCGTCKVRLLSGAVTMAVEDALSAEEKAGGVILACQAKSTAACAVDA